MARHVRVSKFNVDENPMTARLIILGTIAFFAAAAQVQVPSRPSIPLFKGAQGRQRTELHYDPATGIVTMKVLVQDPNGYFVPNIRRENFAVYENGVRQEGVSVTVEHAPVTVGMLLEHGGRQPALNHDLNDEVSRAAQQFLDSLGGDDAAAVWTYADSVSQVADFTKDRLTLARTLVSLQPPEISETNLYDALIFAINRMRPVTARKAILLMSSGIDTFSKATHDDAMKAARQSDTPVYVISLAQVMQEAARLHGIKAFGIDWTGGEKKLQDIATASGARLYSPESTIDLSAIYGDVIENLKIRYVITYPASKSENPGAPRTVRVELVEAGTGNPLRIVDAKRRRVRANAIAEASYTPQPPDRNAQ
jgi:VWFA-related protein